jgi:glucose-6-phosphate-specific signal transduction histidine kinase
LSVEDDGGGTLVRGQSGHGVLGISERTSAMGGELQMRETDLGVRVDVTVPAAIARNAA